MIIIVMGVCGSGKSTVGKQLAEKLPNWKFVDADDFHPDSNKIKMQNGIPLTDEDRFPWLLIQHNIIQRWIDNNENGVLACSALKRQYRHIIFYGQKNDNISSPENSWHQNTNESTHMPEIKGIKEVRTGPDCLSNELKKNFGRTDLLLVHLTGKKDLVEERLKKRNGHFMPCSLLDSQLNTLEVPGSDENCIQVDIENSVDRIIEIVAQHSDVINYLFAG